MTTFGVAGWLVAGSAGALVVVLRRRLELVARAEHELRGPLTAMCLTAERMCDESRKEAPFAGLESHLERARVGLADLTAARTGSRAESRPRFVPLERLVSAAVAGWQPAVQRLGRTMHIRWSAGPVTVLADDRRLAQVMGNLISNAVEHGEGGIELRGRRTGDSVRLEISDEGQGFASRRSNPAGGRGLDIAGQAVEEAGGKLTVLREMGDVAVELPLKDV